MTYWYANSGSLPGAVGPSFPRLHHFGEIDRHDRQSDRATENNS